MGPPPINELQLQSTFPPCPPPDLEQALFSLSLLPSSSHPSSHGMTLFPTLVEAIQQQQHSEGGADVAGARDTSAAVAEQAADAGGQGPLQVVLAGIPEWQVRGSFSPMRLVELHVPARGTL